MRSYEMVLILQADLEDHKMVSEEIAEVVRGLGAELEKVDIWGKKRFAYPIEKRLKNFARLTNDFTVLNIICEEYAKLSGVSTEFCLQKITSAFTKRARKNKIKKILKFYKFFLKK